MELVWAVSIPGGFAILVATVGLHFAFRERRQARSADPVRNRPASI